VLNPVDRVSELLFGLFMALTMTVSRAIALVMLFFGGLTLGRYAGCGSWKVGLMMVGLGAALVFAIIARGG
jgi:hypothetical protein